jgi:hypothetical protein
LVNILIAHPSILPILMSSALSILCIFADESIRQVDLPEPEDPSITTFFAITA